MDISELTFEEKILALVHYAEDNGIFIDSIKTTPSNLIRFDESLGSQVEYFQTDSILLGIVLHCRNWRIYVSKK